MSTLHKEILTEGQVQLLPVLKRFKDDFGLVGGTAIALQIGHRESIDFDLFTKDPEYDFKTSSLLNHFRRGALVGRVLRDRDEELTFNALNVQITFFHFPHRIPFTENVDTFIEMPTLLVLAAMKAYALGYRSKWKDYVDLFFLIRDYHSLPEIIAKTKELFPEFNERLFRQQLPFFEDVSYKEAVVFKPGFEVSDEEIKKSLIEWGAA